VRRFLLQHQVPESTDRTYFEIWNINSNEEVPVASGRNQNQILMKWLRLSTMMPADEYQFYKFYTTTGELHEYQCSGDDLNNWLTQHNNLRLQLQIRYGLSDLGLDDAVSNQGYIIEVDENTKSPAAILSNRYAIRLRTHDHAECAVGYTKLTGLMLAYLSAERFLSERKSHEINHHASYTV
jgi:hypothetical protein